MKKKYSKRYKKILKTPKDTKVLTIEEAIKKVKENCITKFDESIDVSFKLNLKQKKDEVSLRTNVNLPNGTSELVRGYQFRIPINEPTSSVGGLSDFRSIRLSKIN